MLLTDYFRSTPDRIWEFGKQCGVDHATIRLPEDAEFDITNRAHWEKICARFRSANIKPVVIEPLPNALHDHIKVGDAQRDECIEKAIQMLRYMEEFQIPTLCFNFMAHVGWTRTTNKLEERGGALVTGFRMADYLPEGYHISEQELWSNYTYFIRAILPAAEHHGIRLALHPDDPPVSRLGDVSRIMISYANINSAIREVACSPYLGVTMCQATFHIMGEDLYEVIPKLADKIFFVHFRNVTGTKTKFRETFHDNGDLDMARLLRLYHTHHIDVPIRVDHVPTMAGEKQEFAGYDALGRLYANGYLNGLLEATSF